MKKQLATNAEVCALTSDLIHIHLPCYLYVTRGTTVFLGMPDSVHCTKERVETDGEVQTFIHFIKENV